MGKNSDYDCRLRDRGVIHIDKNVLKSFERDRNRMNQGAREIVLGSGTILKGSGEMLKGSGEMLKGSGTIRGRGNYTITRPHARLIHHDMVW